MPPSRNLDLHALECFDAMMRELSVSRAADRMGLSQSSMSEALARLRERFGDPLLVRTRDGMVATDRAKALLPTVRQVIDQMRAMVEREGRFDSAQSSRQFRIATTDYAQVLLMPGLVRRLQVEAPGCTVGVSPVNIREVELALESGDIDLAIAFYPQPPEGLRRGPLLTDRFVCIARHGHPAVSHDLTAEAFAALRHISVSPSGLSYFSDIVDLALDARGLARQVVITCPHFLLASYLVSQSDLVLVLPHEGAKTLARFFPLQVVDVPLTLKPMELSLYWHERCHHSAAQQWLRETVRSVMAPQRVELQALHPAA